MCKLYGYCAAKISIDLCACKSAKEHCSSTQSKKVFCSMKSERSREEYCSVAVSVPVVSDVEPSFLIDSQWSGSRATVGRINYLMKKNWLRVSDAQKKEMRFSLQIMTLYHTGYRIAFLQYRRKFWWMLLFSRFVAYSRVQIFVNHPYFRHIQ